jgi:hypothetical protein
LTRIILDANDTPKSHQDIQKIQGIAKKIKDIELLVEYKK